MNTIQQLKTTSISSVARRKWATRLAAPIAAALMAGCAAVGPDYTRPATPSAQLINASAPGFASERPVASWWAQFGDPVLERLVSESLEANLDLRVAVARVNEARATFGERRSELSPRVSAGVDGARGRQQVDGQGRTDVGQYSAGFDAAWELDLFGRVRRGIEGARAEMQARESDLQDVRVTVAAEVARNYFELRGIQARLDVARRTLDNLGQTQRLTEARFELGAGTQLDVQSSLARVKAVEAELPALEAAEGHARYRLAVLLGKRPGELDAVLASRDAPAFVKALPIGDTGQLLRQRPDVRAAERRLAAATARIGVATADLFPRVSVGGFVGFLSGNWGNLLDSGNRAWQVTPSISWTALDFGAARSRLRATEAQAEGLAVQYEQTVLAALEDAEGALLSYAKQQEQLKRRVEQSQAAHRAADLAERRYRAGSVDFLTLLDAQRTQLAADDALALATAGVNVRVVAVYKALGGLASDGHIQTIAAAR